MDIFSVLVYHEFKVCDLVALREEHPLVESLDFIQRRVGDAPFPVKVCGRSKYAESVRFGDSLGIFMQEAAVSLQVDDASSLEELAVALQEHRARQPAVLALELGVRESQPYLGYFSGSEERFDEFDPGPQEGYVREVVEGGELGPFPEPGSLDVHSDVIAAWKPRRQVDGIFPFSATEFKHYRLLLGEHLPIPSALDRVVVQMEAPVSRGFVQDRGKIRLDEAGESLVLGEFPQFVVAHWLRLNMTPSPLTDSASLRTRAFRRHCPCSGISSRSLKGYMMSLV